MTSEEENIDNNNKITDHVQEYEVIAFQYNFINSPWDDRTKRSKIGIVFLLVAIFVAMMACVINNFVMHYRGFKDSKNISSSDMNCLRVSMENYNFVARIHSVSSKKLLCLGAVVSSTSILANGVCAKSGPIRVFVGSPSIPLCKKGFTVDVIESLYHDAVISMKLVLLSSYDDIAKCSSPISLGNSLDWSSKIYIYGRPIDMGKSLSRQHVALVNKASLPEGFAVKHLNIDHMICVKDLARCPVRAGDLLVQNEQLYGLSATSVHRTDGNNIACFADLNVVRAELRELDVEIG